MINFQSLIAYTFMDEEKKEGINSADRVWSVLAYIWVFAFIPFILRRKREFVFFHAKQGVTLFIIEIILTFIFSIPFLGWLIGIIGFIVCAIFSLQGIFAALAGKKWVMPWFGRYAEKIKS